MHRICLDCQQLTTTSKYGRCMSCAPAYIERNKNKKRNTPTKQTPQRKKRSAIYNTAQWQKARKHAIARDGACTHCGTNEMLTVHHINSITTHPQMAFDPDNLITLCSRCHAQAENQSKKRKANTRTHEPQGGWVVE